MERGKGGGRSREGGGGKEERRKASYRRRKESVRGREETKESRNLKTMEVRVQVGGDSERGREWW